MNQIFRASLGGAAVFTISATNPNTFDGAILLCPALEVDEKMYPILRKIARIIAFVKFKIIWLNWINLFRIDYSNGSYYTEYFRR